MYIVFITILFFPIISQSTNSYDIKQIIKRQKKINTSNNKFQKNHLDKKKIDIINYNNIINKTDINELLTIPLFLNQLILLKDSEKNENKDDNSSKVNNTNKNLTTGNNASDNKTSSNNPNEDSIESKLKLVLIVILILLLIAIITFFLIKRKNNNVKLAKMIENKN